jgi:hypothetical protein
VPSTSALLEATADQFAVVLLEEHEGDVGRHLQAMIDAFLDHPFLHDSDSVGSVGLRTQRYKV